MRLRRIAAVSSKLNAFQLIQNFYNRCRAGLVDFFCGNDGDIGRSLADFLRVACRGNNNFFHCDRRIVIFGFELVLVKK